MEIPVNIDHLPRGGTMSKIATVVAKNASLGAFTVVGIDLAKNVFAVHGVNAG